MKKKNRNTVAKSSFIKQEMNRQNNMVGKVLFHQAGDEPAEQHGQTHAEISGKGGD